MIPNISFAVEFLGRELEHRIVRLAMSPGGC